MQHVLRLYTPICIVASTIRAAENRSCDTVLQSSKENWKKQSLCLQKKQIRPSKIREPSLISFIELRIPAKLNNFAEFWLERGSSNSRHLVFKEVFSIFIIIYSSLWSFLFQSDCFLVCFPHCSRVFQLCWWSYMWSLDAAECPKSFPELK